MVGGKVQCEQCFEAANQESPLTDPSVWEPTMARKLEKSIQIRESRRRSGKGMFRGKVQYEQCFEAANQETPIRNP